MKTIILSLLFSSSLLASTQMGQLIQKTQQKYGEFASAPILIFDRDEIGWDFAKANAYENESRQVEVLITYIKRKFGLEVSLEEAADIAPYLSILTSSATALPVIKFVDGGAKKKFCVVFPPSANSNSQLAHERITGMSTKEVFGPLTYQNLKMRLPYDVLEKYSLYHEVAHCLDDKFIMEAFTSSTGPRDVHLAESFADTLALFFLAKDGYRKVGKIRAIHRTIYSRMMGPYFVAHPAVGMGDANYMRGGVIYYLADVLKKAQKWVWPMSLTSVPKQINRANKIVEKSVMSARSFAAIYILFSEGEEDAVKRYEHNVKEWPEMFEEAYDYLMDYIKDTDRVIEQAFTNEIMPETSDENLIAMDIDKLCDHFRRGNKQAFFNLIDTYRNNLKEVISGADERAVNLDEIYQSLPMACN